MKMNNKKINNNQMNHIYKYKELSVYNSQRVTKV